VCFAYTATLWLLFKKKSISIVIGKTRTAVINPGYAYGPCDVVRQKCSTLLFSAWRGENQGDSLKLRLRDVVAVWRRLLRCLVVEIQSVTMEEGPFDEFCSCDICQKIKHWFLSGSATCIVEWINTKLLAAWSRFYSYRGWRLEVCSALRLYQVQWSVIHFRHGVPISLPDKLTMLLASVCDFYRAKFVFRPLRWP